MSVSVRYVRVVCGFREVVPVEGGVSVLSCQTVCRTFTNKELVQNIC